MAVGLIFAAGFVLCLAIGAWKGLTIGQVLWLIGDAWSDPLKWLRPRDENGRLRPTTRRGNRHG